MESARGSRGRFSENDEHCGRLASQPASYIAVQSSYIVEIPVSTHERLFEAEGITSAAINRYRTTSRETLPHPSRSRYEGWGPDISPLDNPPGHFPRTIPPDNSPGQFPLPTRTIPPVPLKTQLENYIYTYMYAHMHTYIHRCIYT